MPLILLLQPQNLRHVSFRQQQQCSGMQYVRNCQTPYRKHQALQFCQFFCHHPPHLAKSLPSCATPLNTMTVQPHTVSHTNTSATPFSPSDTDLRIDLGVACSLSYLPDLNRFFSMIIDEGNEYLESSPTKIRASPPALLKKLSPS